MHAEKPLEQMRSHLERNSAAVVADSYDELPIASLVISETSTYLCKALGLVWISILDGVR
jgi:hypothetical protein